MIIRTSHALKALNLGIMTLLLVACGGGGTSGPSSSTITGTASKGVLKNAIVAAYAVTSSGQKGDKIASTRTDTTGNYSLSVTAYTGPLILELTTDSDSRMTCDIPAGCGNGVAFAQPSTLPASFTLSSVVPAANSGVVKTAITPFTHLAAEEAKAKGFTKANIEASLTQVAALFNLPPLNTTTPADITASNLGQSSEDAQRYALLNASIGQLANGSISDVNTRLSAITATLIANNGQLKSRSDSSDEIDLQEVLSAANTVINSAVVSTNISTLVKSVIGEDLHAAETAPINKLTEASPASLPGADDLVKAKDFVRSAHSMIESIRSIDKDTNFQSQLEAKYAPVQEVLNSPDNYFSDRLPVLLEVASVIAGRTIKECFTDCGSTNINNKINTQIQAVLDQGFNASQYYGIQSTATNLSGVNGINVTTYQDDTSTTITLNGSFKIKQTNNVYSCLNTMPYTCGYSSQPIGDEETYTLNNFKVKHPLLSKLHPLLSVSQKTHSLTLLKDSKVSSQKKYLLIGADSGLALQFTNTTSIYDFITALEGLNGALPWSMAPNSASFNLSKVTLGATGTTVNFVGDLSFAFAQVKLPNKANPSELLNFALPSQAQLSGTFNGLNGDSLAASLTLTLDISKSNILKGPNDGYTRNGLFAYSYDATSQIATIKVNQPTNTTLQYDYWTPFNTYNFSFEPTWTWCGGGYKALVYRSPGAQSDTRFAGCTSQATVQAALQELLASGNYGIGALIQDEGLYIPDITGKTLGLSPLTLNGRLNWSNGGLSEDTNHFASGALSLQASIQLTGGITTHLANIRLDASRNGLKDATGKLALTIDGKTLLLTSPVIGGEPSFTLSDSNGASVAVGLNNANEDAELIINGNKMGVITTLAGLPVARFVDNSLIAL